MAKGDVVNTDWLLDAVRTVGYDFDALENAKSFGQFANAFTALSNSMSDLVTYLPEYDYNVGWPPVEE